MEVPMKLATRMSRLGTESAFEVLARARALEAKGVDVVHLEIGEPDFTTPRNICDAAIEAINKGYTHYTTSQGLPELRTEIAKNLGATRGVSFDPDRIVVTTGAKPIMFYSILALLGEGDEAIYQDPLFPIYESMINFSGATAVPIPLREELGFRMDVDELRSKVTSRTKLIIINSPQNPSGGVMEEEDIRAIAEIAREHDIIVLSDEIYD
jgi:aspartate aminotransferase